MSAPQLHDGDGWNTIIGFGSLLSKRSAMSSFPSLRNFRCVWISGFRRIMAHTAPIFFERGIAKLETKEISSMCTEPTSPDEPPSKLLVTAFDIPNSEMPAFYEREKEFEYVKIEYHEAGETAVSGVGTMCSKGTDDDYRARHCQLSIAGSTSCTCVLCQLRTYNVDKIWRDDILPCRVYLRHCVLAAKHLSAEVHDNFLDSTFLGDRRTTIRQHLLNDPSIMDELPPESLKYRYDGSQDPPTGP
eukprot:GFYU01015201.1.p1 GENE.GFYU01015201.1~~GFYU01015201.1.p1  ORF type:complete len:245 (+),score=12.64 GFYU01015201.1:36-770(+)